MYNDNYIKIFEQHVEANEVVVSAISILETTVTIIKYTYQC